MEEFKNLSKNLSEMRKIYGLTQKQVAEKLGIKSVGVSADLDTYRGQKKRDLREILARDKDFFKCIFKPKPTYLGDKIPVSGNGNLTND